MIFDISEKSDDLYLIHTGTVQIESSEGLALATLEQGEMFGEMASILGERERTARAVAVVRYLAAQGVPERRMAAAGFGEFFPVAEGTSPEALQRNRRIELKLTDR